MLGIETRHIVKNSFNAIHLNLNDPNSGLNKWKFSAWSEWFIVSQKFWHKLILVHIIQNEMVKENSLTARINRSWNSFSN